VLADTLQNLAGLKVKSRKGKEAVLELLPPATEAEIQALEARLPCPIPADVREALRVAKGLANSPMGFSLVDLEGFGLEEVFPHAYSIADDGCGNFWVLDLLPGLTTWGPVFYACHDPAVVAYQSATLEDFLRESLAWRDSGSHNPIDHVVYRIWRENPGLLPGADLRDSADAVLRAFAASLPPNALVADLRQPAPGDGFSWGRFLGSELNIRRAGHERVWALIPPERKPGILRRLFR